MNVSLSNTIFLLCFSVFIFGASFVYGQHSQVRIGTLVNKQVELEARVGFVREALVSALGEGATIANISIYKPGQTWYLKCTGHLDKTRYSCAIELSVNRAELVLHSDASAHLCVNGTCKDCDYRLDVELRITGCLCNKVDIRTKASACKYTLRHDIAGVIVKHLLSIN